MRRAASLLTAFVLATTSCSSAIDPATADLRGTLIKVGVIGGRVRLGILSDNRYLVALPPGIDFDYTVYVSGKIFAQNDHGFQQILPTQIPLNSRVLVWTTGDEIRTLPAQVTATRVVFPLP